MKNFISKHATVSAFNGAQSTFDKPHVAYIEENQGLNYQAYVAPVVPQHEYVEIGGVKWATMNVGANSVTDTGLYFQWGDTQGYTASQVGEGEGQKYFSISDNIYYNGSRYNKYDSTDEKIIIDPIDDAVTASWGGNWRMPTISEFIALNEAVTTAWTNNYQGSGVSGLICTDKTDSSKVLFFPACGYVSYGNFSDVGSYGYYWSSSLNDDCDYSTAFQFICSSNDIQHSDDSRSNGCSIRGVLVEN